MFVCDLRQVSGFLLVTLISFKNQTGCHYINKILLKVVSICNNPPQKSETDIIKVLFTQSIKNVHFISETMYQQYNFYSSYFPY